ncbi:hypothetical protein MicloDRAFT_00064410 [Microvirga lotononidis]|uniref:Uncharacterized protein n=2 Tax=Microvirga lotononidis TaxID=864069 RepID=I4YP22_9HYPH|nr:hypothetical protein MicloDRAFT_00064410 [Microvirga lotononidis]
MIFESNPRAVVSSERYRELETLAMQLLIQLPTDEAEILIVRDIVDNHVRRWLTDERLPRHRDTELWAETVVPIKKTAD